MRKWLAVHVRRSDKLAQCPENGVGLSALADQIARRCAALGCGGAFLCSCDAGLKAALTTTLGERHGLLAAILPEATLPTSPDLAPHLDASIDARRNAEDCVIEVPLMARCAGLLCMWSHVSVAVVYMAREGYPWAMFGDGEQALAAPPPPSARSAEEEEEEELHQASEQDETTQRVVAPVHARRAWAAQRWGVRRRA